jgi:leucyl aminopeptidase
MEIRATDTPRLNWTGDALAVGLFEEALELVDDLAQLDEKLGGTLKELIEETEFKGSVGSSAVTRVGADSSIRKIILVGLGKPEALKIDSLRRAAAAIARTAKQQKSKTLGISLPVFNNDPALTAQAITEGIVLALHQDNRFKSEPEDKGTKLEQVDLLGVGSQEAAITHAQAICTGVILARELVAAPANVVTPISMAETAEAIASEYGLALEILEQEECEKLGMGAFLGVAKASDLPPKFIHLTYKPNGTPRRKVAIVGKGLSSTLGIDI